MRFVQAALSFIFTDNKYVFPFNIFYIKQKNTQNRRHSVPKMAEKLCLPTKKWVIYGQKWAVFDEKG